MRYVVALTGSHTGCQSIQYGIRLLEELDGERELIISEMGKKVLDEETGLTMEDLESNAEEVYDDDDLFAPPASGSHRFDAMIICPCTQSTLAKIAAGIADTLITRAASVTLKERRKLIIVPRETPISAIMLENELRLAKAGAIILPASPAFYAEPRSVDDMVNFVVGKILDQVGQEHELFRRWE